MILVVGGAGYIGSHFVKELVKTHDVVVLDNLSTGHRWAVDQKATFIEGDLGDADTVQRLFDTYTIEAVLHFAAFSLVSESVADPMKYYENNVIATFNLLKLMKDNHIDKFIFSSTAATYGTPDVELIDEHTVTAPINPYGHSKLMVEQMVKDLAYSYGLKYAVLRYFNAAGADETAEIGESHSPETHLIPLVLQHLLGQRSAISVYGTDYDTPDGTCIRDYIHVTDLAKAHLLALEGLLNGTLTASVYNLGNSHGYSVKEIIAMCEQVANKQANIQYIDRRAGDPAILVANAEKIYQELGWKAQFDLQTIIESAWAWHQKQF
ncbi:UDP-glucose 4-epimerase GalE [Metasolibacillus meyeri]|uniref:UDP-glucose 4-epimerase GalE n=1 Tax=Metasolibacillus meyeri TaxID=1071052 RepID=UPI000D2FDBFC|nr:UDP-glucose 4-epimerase GalE [Metasolibacillus meyeri]